MTFEIVIARYNEDLEWTKLFPNVIIYNKGAQISDEYNSISLNNVGREGHTIYKYIYDNYNHLKDHTIFFARKPI